MAASTPRDAVKLVPRPYITLRLSLEESYGRRITSHHFIRGTHRYPSTCGDGGAGRVVQPHRAQWRRRGDPEARSYAARNADQGQHGAYDVYRAQRWRA